MAPDEPSLVVVNPEAIGDPLATPVVFVVGDAMREVFHPCEGDAPSRGGKCNGVNGFHADDCEAAGA